MLTDVHSRKVSLPISISTTGDNVIVTGDNDSWIYVHEVIGSLDAAGLMKIKSGTTDLAEFDLDAGQGLTEDDIPGDDGVPRFQCKPGDDFIINLPAGATFTGSVVYSRRF